MSAAYRAMTCIPVVQKVLANLGKVVQETRVGWRLGDDALDEGPRHPRAPLRRVRHDVGHRGAVDRQLQALPRLDRGYDPGGPVAKVTN